MLSKTLMAASTRPVILAILSGGEDYGYSIIQKVKQVSGGDLKWTFGMLYPVLQRMEIDGQVRSRWKMDGDNRPRHYFQITAAGRQALKAEIAGWKQVLQAMTAFSEPRLSES